MNFSFKEHLKNSIIGFSAAVPLGVVCGGVAAVVGANQFPMCNMIPKEDLDIIMTRAALAGAGFGGAVGFVAGAIIYPMYKNFAGRLYPSVTEVSGNIIDSSRGILSSP